jgi:hypothetical protein
MLLRKNIFFLHSVSPVGIHYTTSYNIAESEVL